MADVELANAIIAAALIQSGEFKLSAFDERGEPRRGQDGSGTSEAERLIAQADTLDDPDFDFYSAPALATLRKLTNAIRRALHEPPSDLATPNAEPRAE